MNKNDLFKAIGDIDDKFIEEAASVKKKRNKVKIWQNKTLLSAASLFLCLGVGYYVIQNGNMGQKTAEDSDVQIQENTAIAPNVSDSEKYEEHRGVTEVDSAKDVEQSVIIAEDAEEAGAAGAPINSTSNKNELTKTESVKDSEIEKSEAIEFEETDGIEEEPATDSSMLNNSTSQAERIQGLNELAASIKGNRPVREEYEASDAYEVEDVERAEYEKYVNVLPKDMELSSAFSVDGYSYVDFSHYVVDPDAAATDRTLLLDLVLYDLTKDKEEFVYDPAYPDETWRYVYPIEYVTAEVIEKSKGEVDGVTFYEVTVLYPDNTVVEYFSMNLTAREVYEVLNFENN